MSTIIDSYSESNSTNSLNVGDGSNMGHYYYVGQSITGNGSPVEKCTFYLNKYGSPTGSVYAKIYAHTGVFGTSSLPTGSPLAVSDPLDVSTLTSSTQLIDFNFSGANQISLENSTHYIVMCGGLTGANSTNYIQIYYDGIDPAHGGNMCYLSGAWSYGATDLVFYIYGIEILTPVVGQKYALPPFRRS